MRSSAWPLGRNISAHTLNGIIAQLCTAVHRCVFHAEVHRRFANMQQLRRDRNVPFSVLQAVLRLRAMDSILNKDFEEGVSLQFGRVKDLLKQIVLKTSSIKSRFAMPHQPIRGKPATYLGPAATYLGSAAT